jgi:glycosyltransferase involved in cell wall biosynthesis
MKKIESSLVILTRNEIEGLKALIRKIPFETVDEYFAVDYQSTDGTVEFFQKHDIPVIKQRLPGRGQAFKLAAKHAKGKYLIYFSPDGNENPADIPRLLRELKKGNDLAIASRFLKQSRNEEDDQLLKFRKWANQSFTVLAKLIWGGKVADSINGYRAIKKDVFNELNLSASGYAIEYQMTIRCLKLKKQVAEIPTIEGNRIGGESGSKAIPTGIKFVKLLFNEIIIGKSFLSR